MTAMGILQKEQAALIYQRENRTVNATAMDVPDLIGIRGVIQYYYSMRLYD